MTVRRARLSALAALATALPAAAHASFLSGDALDTAATVLAWIVIFVAPVIAIGLFLVVHVLPEKIAEKNHHPQQNAIKTLCFLSLVFGGMLWPFAWLWAFTRPIGYRAVYGTEKHEHYFIEMGEKAASGELSQLEIDHLRDELAAMAARGPLPAAIRELPALVAQARPKAPESPPAAAPAAGGAR